MKLGLAAAVMFLSIALPRSAKAIECILFDYKIELVDTQRIEVRFEWYGCKGTSKLGGYIMLRPESRYTQNQLVTALLRKCKEMYPKARPEAVEVVGDSKKIEKVTFYLHPD